MRMIALAQHLFMMLSVVVGEEGVDVGRISDGSWIIQDSDNA